MPAYMERTKGHTAILYVAAVCTPTHVWTLDCPVPVHSCASRKEHTAKASRGRLAVDLGLVEPR